ncbi:MAG: hypothetical protein ACREF9_15705 [Opitutaceae bacterium]
MHGAEGWYGWQLQPWNVGALELWYLSMRADDARRAGDNDWIADLDGRDANHPETTLRRDLATVARKRLLCRGSGSEAVLGQHRSGSFHICDNPPRAVF